MRSISSAVRIVAILSIYTLLQPAGPNSVEAAPLTIPSSAPLTSVRPQEPPPPDTPVITSDQTVIPSRITGLFSDLPSLEEMEANAVSRVRLSMPATTINVDGLLAPDHSTSNPPQVDGAVGPYFYVQVVDSHIGIFDSSDGALLASESFASLWEVPDNPTNPCEVETAGANYHIGYPSVLYDHLSQRWIVADVAVGNLNYAAGPFYLCVAVSTNAEPLDWIRWGIAVVDPWLPDSPELGVWPEGIYVSADMYDCDAGCVTPVYQGPRNWALNSAALYAGAGLGLGDVQYTTLSTTYHDLLPSTVLGVAPPSSTPNYLAAKATASSNIEIWKFDVDWTTPGNSTFTGPTQVAISYTAPPALVPQKTGEGEDLDSQGARLLPDNQYRKVGAVESLWLTQTVGDGGSPNVAGLGWYQLDVTGGTVDTTPAQSGTFFNGDDGIYRWVPSLAVDTEGNMAVGYGASSSALNPEIRYAGRLIADAAGTLAQGESTLIGTNLGAQDGASGTWGPHSSMTIDPTDDCTFWYTNMYYTAADTGTANWTTRMSAFKFAGCLLENITVSGNAGLPGVELSYDNGGAQTVTADGSGNYSFLVAAGWSGTVTPELPHYFFDPPSREYTSITSNQTAQDYTPYPYVRFEPANGATVCRTPYIVVKLILSDLTRNVSGAFNLSTVTFTLDGGNIKNLATIRVPQTSPHAWAYFLYQPSSQLSLGSHTVQFTHPEASGTIIDSWTFTAANIGCTGPTLLSAPADSQTIQAADPAAPTAAVQSSPGTRSSLVGQTPGDPPAEPPPAAPKLTDHESPGSNLSTDSLSPPAALTSDPGPMKQSATSPSSPPQLAPVDLGAPLHFPLLRRWPLLIYLKPR